MRKISVEDLVEIEQIRQLKARYCLAVDSKDWEMYRSVFTDDARLGGGLPDGAAAEGFVGPEEWVRGVAATIGSFKTLHTTHASIVEIVDAQSARGLWQYTQRGWGRTGGYYDERYDKSGGEWRIARMHILPVFANHGEDTSESAPGSFAEVASIWREILAPRATR